MRDKIFIYDYKANNFDDIKNLDVNLRFLNKK